MSTDAYSRRLQPAYHQRDLDVNNDEEWTTRRKVETVTKRNVERHVQRQVVLEDGRVIDEDDPHVTVDTVEDTQMHEDSGDEDRQVGLGQVSYERGDNVFGERFERTVRTNDLRERASTSAAARNLGEMSHKDVDDVIRGGRDPRLVAKPYDSVDSRALVLPARVIHANAAHKRTVDKEDVHEVNRMQDGRIKTERYVTRELVEDDGNETPEEGDSTESEFADADGRAFTQRKEDRYIDYYRVPKGKTHSEGKYLSRGIHLTSHDKDERRFDPWAQRSRAKPLTYSRTVDDQSDLSSEHATKPPLSDRPPSRGRRPLPLHERNSVGDSERSFSKSRHASTGDRRFHTIERSQRLRSTSRSDMGQPRPPHRSQEMLSGRRSDSERSYRSRSMSRSSAGPADHASPRMREDLDPERENRLRRTMSFTSTKSAGPLGAKDGKGLLDSVKSLYATITKSGKKKNGSVKSSGSSHDAWFDRGQHTGSKPQPPPRKNTSTTHLSDSGAYAPYRSDGDRGSRVYSDATTGRTWSAYSPSRATSTTSIAKTALGTARGHETRHTQSRSMSSGVGRVTPPSPAAGRPRPQPRSRPERRSVSSAQHRDRGSWAASAGSREDVQLENRDLPRFEDRRRERSAAGRFFGQEDTDVEERERPAPDMRRMLLSNVNVSRKKSMSKEADARPMIRAV